MSELQNFRDKEANLDLAKKLNLGLDYFCRRARTGGDDAENKDPLTRGC